MRINGYKHHTGGSSNKASSKKGISDDGKIRIIPGTGHSSDSGKSLKENISGKIALHLDNGDALTEKQMIEEGLSEYYGTDQESGTWADELGYYRDGVFHLLYEHEWFNDDLVKNYSGGLDETKTNLDFLDFDTVNNENDKKALRLLQKSRVLSIEDNGANIDENTILYVREKKYRKNGEVKNVFVREKITLKALFSYFATSEKNYTKALNMFIDKNNIIELNLNIFNPKMRDDGDLPRELREYNGKSILKIRKNAA